MFDHRGTLAAKFTAGTLALTGLAGCSQTENNGTQAVQQSIRVHEPGWRDLCLFPPKPPVIEWEKFSNRELFISAHEGWSSSTIGKILGSGLEVALPVLSEKMGVPAAVARVHFWEDNMPPIREAAAQGRKIVVVGYSAGSDQAKRTIRKCDEEGIFISLVVLLDPTCTSKAPLPIFTTLPAEPFTFPENVGKVVVIMSGGSPFDPLALGRGSEAVVNEAAQKDPRITPVRVMQGETHFSLGLPKLVVPLIEEQLAGLRNALPASRPATSQ